MHDSGECVRLDNYELRADLFMKLSCCWWEVLGVCHW